MPATEQSDQPLEPEKDTFIDLVQDSVALLDALDIKKARNHSYILELS